MVPTLPGRQRQAEGGAPSRQEGGSGHGQAGTLHISWRLYDCYRLSGRLYRHVHRPATLSRAPGLRVYGHVHRHVNGHVYRTASLARALGLCVYGHDHRHLHGHVHENLYRLTTLARALDLRVYGHDHRHVHGHVH